MVPVAIVTDLVLQLAYVASTTRQPALLLDECLPLRLLLYLQLSELPLLALPDELQLLRQRIHLLAQLLRLILRQQVLQLFFAQLEVAYLLLLLLQLLVLALQLHLPEVLLVQVLLQLPVLMPNLPDAVLY